jgi:hypothetical protein
LGAVPYDFEELRPLGIHNLDFTDLESKGKTELGMIINLDEHLKKNLFNNLNLEQSYY